MPNRRICPAKASDLKGRPRSIPAQIENGRTMYTNQKRIEQGQYSSPFGNLATGVPASRVDSLAGNLKSNSNLFATTIAKQSSTATIHPTIHPTTTQKHLIYRLLQNLPFRFSKTWKSTNPICAPLAHSEPTVALSHPVPATFAAFPLHSPHALSLINHTTTQNTLVYRP